MLKHDDHVKMEKNCIMLHLFSFLPSLNIFTFQLYICCLAGWVLLESEI